MRFLKRGFIAAGALALAAMFLNFVAPKAVHAAVAALVQVANTTASPAIVSDMDDPGRIPYQAQLAGSTGSQCSSSYDCTFRFAPVPTGHRLVVQHVSAYIQVKSGSAPAEVRVGSQCCTYSQFPVTVQVGGDLPFDQPVLAYLDGGETPVVDVVFGSASAGVNTSDPASSQTMYLFGYLLDCNAAPCSAIVRH